MAIEISGPVNNLVALALNAATMRHDAISNNIANINTPGYKPLRVSFEEQLKLSLTPSLMRDDVVVKKTLASLRPEIFEVESVNQINQLDLEMVEMAKNTLRYETLLKGLSSYGAITKMAIKEGKV